jgi:signal transduction histidine kinase
MDYAPVFRVLSHELRAPTAVIGGYARLLREGRLQEPERLQALVQIEQATAKLSQFARQASELAHWLVPRSATGAAVRAGELIHRAGTKCSVAADRILLECDEPASAAVIEGVNVEALAAAIASIMEAAGREAVEGPIRVRVRHTPGSPPWDLFVGPAAAAAWSDRVNGPESGDPPGVDRGGMGLAFILAAAVTQAHGGELWSVGGRQGLVALRLFISRE